MLRHLLGGTFFHYYLSCLQTSPVRDKVLYSDHLYRVVVSHRHHTVGVPVPSLRDLFFVELFFDVRDGLQDDLVLFVGRLGDYGDYV